LIGQELSTILRLLKNDFKSVRSIAINNKNPYSRSYRGFYCEPKESNSGGEADSLTKLKSSDFSD
jgi:hypothetical protein